MKKISVLFIFLFSMFPKAYATKTSHLSEQDLKKIYSQNPSLKEELEQQDPIFALACLGKTELQHYDTNKLLITNPVSKRTILHYLARFDHHQLLHSLLQKYHSLKQKINILDSYGFTPLHYAVINSSIECIQLLLPHNDPLLNNQDDFDAESLENCDEPNVKPLCVHTYPQCCSNIDEASDDLTPNVTPFPDNSCLYKETENKLYNYYVSDNQLLNVKNHPFIEMPQPKSSEIVKEGKKHSRKYDQFFNHATQKYECPECEKTYTKGKDLGQHIEKKHNSGIVQKRKKRGSKYDQFYNSLTKKYVCPDCGEKYTHSNALAYHMKNQHKSEIVKKRKKLGSKYDQFFNHATQKYDCPGCRAKYKNSQDLAKHMKNQHSSKIVTAIKKRSSKYDQFYNPLSQKYVCPDCGNHYLESFILGQHMKKEHQSKIVKKRNSKYDQFFNSLSQKYVCPDCGKKYARGAELGQHMKNQHNSEIVKEGKKRGSKYNQFFNPTIQEYECPDCGEKYVTSRYLGQHMKNQHQITVKKDGTIKTIEIT